MKINSAKMEAAILIMKNIKFGIPTKTSELSRITGKSHCYFEQVIRDLRIGGIVHAVRGPGGGYVKVKNPNLLQLINALSDEETIDTIKPYMAKVNKALEKIYL